MAESVFSAKTKELGLENNFEIESAGTAAYHIGEWPDSRTISTLLQNGIDNYSRARQVKKADLAYFDYVFAMDNSNLSDLLLLKDESSTAQISLYRDFDNEKGDKIVPDPYYGSQKDFDLVYEMVSRSSNGFLKSLNF